MHWSVEISTLGKSVAAPERLEVEATQWQNALKSARNQTGLDDSLRNFSIEVLEDGVRAVDPANRLRYVVRKLKEETARPEEPAPATQRLGSVPPPAAESWSTLSARTQESFKPKPVAIPAIPMDRPPPPPARPMIAPPAQEKPKPASLPPAAPVASAAPVAAVAPAAAVAAVAPVAPAPPAKQLVPHKQVLARGSEPTPGSPLTYREYGYAVLPFTTEAEAEELILAKFEEVKQSLAHVARGKLVNLAIFDHEFDTRPLRPPVVALVWKDWRNRDPELHYPARPDGTSPSLTPSIPPVEPVALLPEPPKPEPVAQPAHVPEPVGQALYQEPVRVPPRTAQEPAPAQSVIISPAVRTPSQPPAAAYAALQAAIETRKASQPPAAAPVAPAESKVPAQPPAAAAPVAPEAVATATPVAASAEAEDKVDTQPEIPSARRESRPVGATMPSAQLESALQMSKAAAPAPAAEQPVAEKAETKPEAEKKAEEPPKKAEEKKAEEPPKKAEEKKAEEPPKKAEEPAKKTQEPPKKAEEKKPVVVATVEPVKAKASPKPTPVPKTGARLSDDELIADLFEATADLAFLRDAEEGADFVLNLVLEKFRSQAGMVQLYDINKREFVIMRAAGPHANLVLGGRTAERDPLVHEIMKRRRPYVLDVAKDGRVRAGRWAALGAHPKMILAAAVELQGQFLGIIEIANPIEGTFTNAEVNGMAYLADSFAEFLANRGIVFESDTSLQTGK